MSNPTTISMNLDDLTVAEVELIEETIGLSIDDAFKPGMMRGPVLRAIALVTLRRTNPDATLEDAGACRIQLSEPNPTDAAS